MPAVALAVLAGCAVAVPERYGERVLTRGAGQPLPATLYAGDLAGPGGPQHYRVLATGGSLRLTAEGTYVLDVDLSVSVDGQPTPPPRWRDRGSVVEMGHVLTLTSEVVQNVTYRAVVRGPAVDVAFGLDGLVGVPAEAVLTFEPAAP